MELAAAILAFGETLFAIDRTIAARLKRNFTFLLALRASRLEHLSRPSAESTAPATLICHAASLFNVN